MNNGTFHQLINEKVRCHLFTNFTILLRAHLFQFFDTNSLDRATIAASHIYFAMHNHLFISLEDKKFAVDVISLKNHLTNLIAVRNQFH